ncbi:hypothetical protein HIM_02517 [Hirsutella minnesotensis 3608]|nr:hypothetical protein HIM_02517 [Hirsutella minnesotensis 3608]
MIRDPRRRSPGSSGRSRRSTARGSRETLTNLPPEALSQDRFPPPPTTERPRAPSSSYSSSSSASSLLDISRHYPTMGSRFGGVFTTFFKAPSERTRRRSRRSSASKKRRILPFSNSSSSSVNSDLAYGSGYIARPKSRVSSASRRRSHRSQERGAAFPAEAPGRPGMRRDRTDEEILEIGRQLSDFARKQNDLDLRAAGRSRPTGLAAAAAAAAATASAFRRRRRETGKSRGIGSSRHRDTSSADDDDWESASDDDDHSSSDAADSMLAYGPVVSQPVQPPAATARGGALTGMAAASTFSGSSMHGRQGSVVDPRLFGPVNSLHGLVTPRPFTDDESAAPAAQYRNFNLLRRIDSEPVPQEQVPMRQVMPIPTADPTNFDAEAASSISVSRSGPMQQPVPKAPVPPKVFEADQIEDASRRDSQKSSQRRDEKRFGEAAVAGVAAAAIGAALVSDRQERSSERREGKKREERKMEQRDSREHRDTDRQRPDGTYDKLERGDRNSKYDRDRERDAERDKDRRRSKHESYPPSKRPDRDHKRSQRHEEERPSRRRSQTTTNHTYESIVPKDQFAERPRETAAYRQRVDRKYEDTEKKDIRTTEETVPRRDDEPDRQVERTFIDPFQYRVDDALSAEPEAAPARPLTPTVVTVDREPNFDNWSPTYSRDMRMSRKDSHDIERLVEDKHLQDRNAAEWEQEAHEVNEAHDEARHSTAPIAAAAMASAIAFERVLSRQRRRQQYSDDGSQERQSAAEDAVQEEANRYYREVTLARKIVEEEEQADVHKDDRSVMDKWSDDGAAQTVTIVTPPEVEDREARRKASLYDAPDADVRIDNKIFPRDIDRFRLSGAERDVADFKSRDPSCERDRPLLNLVYPTPVPSRYGSPSRNPKSGEQLEEHGDVSWQAQIPEIVVETKNEVTQPSTPKSVTWGENSTKRFEVESPEPRSEAEKARGSPGTKEKSRPVLSSSTQWGIIAAAIAGSSAEPENEPKVQADAGLDDPSEAAIKKVLAAGPDQIFVEETVASPPVPGRKPASPVPRQGSGGYADDIEFAATLAAGLKDTGFDPNIVIEDPAFRRRDSPPGESGLDGDEWGRKTSSGIGLGLRSEPIADERAVSEPGFVFGEVGTPGDRSGEAGHADEWAELPPKLSRKLKRRPEKLNRFAIDTSGLVAAESSGSPAADDVAATSPKLSKKERRRRDRESRDYTTESVEEPRLETEVGPGQTVQDDPKDAETIGRRERQKSEGVLEFRDGAMVKGSLSADAYGDMPTIRMVTPEVETAKESQKEPTEGLAVAESEDLQRIRMVTPDEGREASHYSKDKSGRDSGAFENEDAQLIRMVAPEETRDASKKSNKKPKRHSGAYDSETSLASSSKRGSMSKRSSGIGDDFDDSGDEPPPSSRRSQFEDRDVSSVVSEPRYSGDKKREKRDGKRSSRHEDDDSKSVASAPGDSRRGKEPDKKPGGLFSNMFKTAGNKDESKKDSFLDNAGTSGKGVGLATVAAVAAAALARPYATASSADKEQHLMQTLDEPEDLDIDPEIAPRAFKPAIDPQYGDLLPLPPSEPGSPWEEAEDLPRLPDSRPDTPPEERSLKRDSSMMRRRRSMQENPGKSPSSTAIPISLRLGQRGAPTPPGTMPMRASPAGSPISNPESASKRSSRFISWDSSREMMPLYLLEHSRHQSDDSVLRHSDLPSLPSSGPPSRVSPNPEAEETTETTEIVDNEAGAWKLAESGLRIDTKLEQPSEDQNVAGSQETTPRAETKPELPDLSSPNNGGDEQNQYVEPAPVESMSKDRSSYLLNTTPSSTQSNRSSGRAETAESPCELRFSRSKSGLGVTLPDGSDDLLSADEHFSDALEAHSEDSFEEALDSPFRPMFHETQVQEEPVQEPVPASALAAITETEEAEPEEWKSMTARERKKARKARKKKSLDVASGVTGVAAAAALSGAAAMAAGVFTSDTLDHSKEGRDDSKEPIVSPEVAHEQPKTPMTDETVDATDVPQREEPSGQSLVQPEEDESATAAEGNNVKSATEGDDYTKSVLEKATPEEPIATTTASDAETKDSPTPAPVLGNEIDAVEVTQDLPKTPDSAVDVESNLPVAEEPSRDLNQDKKKLEKLADVLPLEEPLFLAEKPEGHEDIKTVDLGVESFHEQKTDRTEVSKADVKPEEEPVAPVAEPETASGDLLSPTTSKKNKKKKKKGKQASIDRGEPTTATDKVIEPVIPDTAGATHESLENAPAVATENINREAPEVTVAELQIAEPSVFKPESLAKQSENFSTVPKQGAVEMPENTDTAAIETLPAENDATANDKALDPTFQCETQNPARSEPVEALAATPAPGESQADPEPPLGSATVQPEEAWAVPASSKKDKKKKKKKGRQSSEVSLGEVTGPSSWTANDPTAEKANVSEEIKQEENHAEPDETSLSTKEPSIVAVEKETHTLPDSEPLASVPAETELPSILEAPKSIEAQDGEVDQPVSVVDHAVAPEEHHIDATPSAQEPVVFKDRVFEQPTDLSVQEALTEHQSDIAPIAKESILARFMDVDQPLEHETQESPPADKPMAAISTVEEPVTAQDKETSELGLLGAKDLASAEQQADASPDIEESSNAQEKMPDQSIGSETVEADTMTTKETKPGDPEVDATPAEPASASKGKKKKKSKRKSMQSEPEEPDAAPETDQTDNADAVSRELVAPELQNFSAEPESIAETTSGDAQQMPIEAQPDSGAADVVIETKPHDPFPTIYSASSDNASMPAENGDVQRKDKAPSARDTPDDVNAQSEVVEQTTKHDGELQITSEIPPSEPLFSQNEPPLDPSRESTDLSLLQSDPPAETKTEAPDETMVSPESESFTVSKKKNKKKNKKSQDLTQVTVLEEVADKQSKGADESNMDAAAATTVDAPKENADDQLATVAKDEQASVLDGEDKKDLRETTTDELHSAKNVDPLNSEDAPANSQDTAQVLQHSSTPETSADVVEPPSVPAVDTAVEAPLPADEVPQPISKSAKKKKKRQSQVSVTFEDEPAVPAPADESEKTATLPEPVAEPEAEPSGSKKSKKNKKKQQLKEDSAEATDNKNGVETETIAQVETPGKDDSPAQQENHQIVSFPDAVENLGESKDDKDSAQDLQVSASDAAPELPETTLADTSSANQEEPAAPVKMSKKDKKKKKKQQSLDAAAIPGLMEGLSKLDDTKEESPKEPALDIRASPEDRVNHATDESKTVDFALAKTSMTEPAVPDEATKATLVGTIGQQSEATPDDDAWGGFSLKKSRKDKKKNKKAKETALPHPQEPETATPSGPEPETTETHPERVPEASSENTTLEGLDQPMPSEPAATADVEPSTGPQPALETEKVPEPGACDSERHVPSSRDPEMPDVRSTPTPTEETTDRFADKSDEQAPPVTSDARISPKPEEAVSPVFKKDTDDLGVTAYLNAPLAGDAEVLPETAQPRDNTVLERSETLAELEGRPVPEKEPSAIPDSPSDATPKDAAAPEEPSMSEPIPVATVDASSQAVLTEDKILEEAAEKPSGPKLVSAPEEAPAESGPVSEKTTLESGSAFRSKPAALGRILTKDELGPVGDTAEEEAAFCMKLERLLGDVSGNVEDETQTTPTEAVSASPTQERPSPRRDSGPVLSFTTRRQGKKNKARSSSRDESAPVRDQDQAFPEAHRVQEPALTGEPLSTVEGESATAEKAEAVLLSPVQQSEPLVKPETESVPIVAAVPTASSDPAGDELSCAPEATKELHEEKSVDVAAAEEIPSPAENEKDVSLVGERKPDAEWSLPAGGKKGKKDKKKKRQSRLEQNPVNEAAVETSTVEEVEAKPIVEESVQPQSDATKALPLCAEPCALESKADDGEALDKNKRISEAAPTLAESINRDDVHNANQAGEKELPQVVESGEPKDADLVKKETDGSDAAPQHATELTASSDRAVEASLSPKLSKKDKKKQKKAASASDIAIEPVSEVLQQRESVQEPDVASPFDASEDKQDGTEPFQESSQEVSDDRAPGKKSKRDKKKAQKAALAAASALAATVAQEPEAEPALDKVEETATETATGKAKQSPNLIQEVADTAAISSPAPAEVVSEGLDTARDHAQEPIASQETPIEQERPEADAVIKNVPSEDVVHDETESKADVAVTSKRTEDDNEAEKDAADVRAETHSEAPAAVPVEAESEWLLKPQKKGKNGKKNQAAAAVITPTETETAVPAEPSTADFKVLEGENESMSAMEPLPDRVESKPTEPEQTLPAPENDIWSSATKQKKKGKRGKRQSVSDTPVIDVANSTDAEPSQTVVDSLEQAHSLGQIPQEQEPREQPEVPPVIEVSAEKPSGRQSEESIAGGTKPTAESPLPGADLHTDELAVPDHKDTPASLEWTTEADTLEQPSTSSAQDIMPLAEGEAEQEPFTSKKKTKKGKGKKGKGVAWDPIDQPTLLSKEETDLAQPAEEASATNDQTNEPISKELSEDQTQKQQVAKESADVDEKMMNIEGSQDFPTVPESHEQKPAMSPWDSTMTEAIPDATWEAPTKSNKGKKDKKRKSSQSMPTTSLNQYVASGDVPETPLEKGIANMDDASRSRDSKEMDPAISSLNMVKAEGLKTQIPAETLPTSTEVVNVSEALVGEAAIERVMSDERPTGSADMSPATVGVSVQEKEQEKLADRAIKPPTLDKTRPAKSSLSADNDDTRGDSSTKDKSDKEPDAGETKAIAAAGALAGGVALLTAKFGGSKKKKDKGKIVDKRAPREDDIFDDPVLWEGAEKKRLEVEQMPEMNGSFWGGDEENGKPILLEEARASPAPMSESLTGSEGGWKETSRQGAPLQDEHAESPILGRGENATIKPEPTGLLRREPEVEEPVGGLLRERAMMPGLLTGSVTPELISPYRPLHAVQEIPGAEEEEAEAMRRGSWASPEVNRDSGFGSGSPKPRQRRSLLFANEAVRDSGVHVMEDGEDRMPRTPEISRVRGTKAQPSPYGTPVVGSGTPVLREPPPAEATPEPEKKRSKKNYGDLGGVAAATLATAIATGAVTGSRDRGRRAASDSQAVMPTDSRETEPSPRAEASFAARRTASNTSLARRRTPEPLKFRPESPGIPRVTPAPPLRRVDKRMSGDLRALRRQSSANSLVLDKEKDADRDKDRDKHAHASIPSSTSPSSSSSPPPVANESRVRAKDRDKDQDMTDVYNGYGEGRIGSPRSPTRPHSMRRRQSMQVLELESRVEQLVAENRLLAEARAHAEQSLSQRAAVVMSERDAEIESLKQSLQYLQNEVTRLTEVNDGLSSANAELAAKDNGRYADLEVRHASVARELDEARGVHNAYSQSLQDKDAEIADLRAQLEAATQQIRDMQRKILESKADNPEFLTYRDEDYFDNRCQQLCSHVQQWVLRFSKFSDMRACRLTSEINDEKTIDRLDNAVLDGSDVDSYLNDRVKRRDIFMSMTMNMIWEFVFTRYLFGMDREQRQKLKSLEKLLTEVGPAQAVRQWRAVTLTLLSKRASFKEQRELDTEAVVQAIFQTLCKILPPPGNLEGQIQSQLRRVMREAVDLSIEMRTQRAEYMMLPPLQPEYDADGELAATVHFDASMMNERSGSPPASNEELEAQGAVVRIVLFPLVVKKGDELGVGEDKIVVCPAQVLVARDKGKRHVAPSSDAGGASLLGAPSRLSVVTDHSMVHSDGQ